jgi:rubrerythrin
MVEKADTTEASLLLDVILQESRKHRELLTHMSKAFEDYSAPSASDCGEQLGQLFTQGLSLLCSIKDEVLNGTSVTQVAHELVDFEKSVSEEYVTAAYARIGAISESNSTVKKILEDIAEDERGHVELLKLVVDMAAKKDS